MTIGISVVGALLFCSAVCPHAYTDTSVGTSQEYKCVVISSLTRATEQQQARRNYCCDIVVRTIVESSIRIELVFASVIKSY
eukprot:17752-Heterococcus_DN1.PRE.1